MASGRQPSSRYLMATQETSIPQASIPTVRMKVVRTKVVRTTLARPNHWLNPAPTTPCSGAAVRRPNSRCRSASNRPAAYWLAALRVLPLDFS